VKACVVGQAKKANTMPLSDEERRRLEELESLLSAQDPSLARNLEEGKPGNAIHRRMVFASLAFVAGAVLVVAGVATQVLLLGVAGFLVECAAAYWFLEGQGTPPRTPLFHFKPKS
jgi:hypothetical protein